MTTNEPRCADGTHVWDEDFTDGDTCTCGAFYLDLHPPPGFVAILQATPPLDFEVPADAHRPD